MCAKQHARKEVLTEAAAKYLAMQAGIFNELGSGGNVDLYLLAKGLRENTADVTDAHAYPSAALHTGADKFAVPCTQYTGGSQLHTAFWIGWNHMI